MFGFYTIMLMVSGLLMVGLGIGVRDLTTGLRVLNVLLGLAFFGYGIYLQFIFQGDSYRILFYAFVAPILLLVRAVSAIKNRKPTNGYVYPAVNTGGATQPPLGAPVPPQGYGVMPQSPAPQYPPANAPQYPGYAPQHHYQPAAPQHQYQQPAAPQQQEYPGYPGTPTS